MSDILYKKEVYEIVGAAIEVHKELGPGFLEAVYQEALKMELEMRGIPFESQKPINIHYKNRLLEKEYIADLVCYGNIIIELKSTRKLTDVESAQLLNYLKASGWELGLLINFGSVGKLEWKRMVLTDKNRGTVKND